MRDQQRVSFEILAPEPPKIHEGMTIFKDEKSGKQFIFVTGNILFVEIAEEVD